ncbi:c-type cytochrome [Myxococcus sp. K38C18041901]|uniref:cbb3-type cytochrome c oxidase N-terminal domain-containing protein n=1 Tax=Myxococcus guangdongensis TaxID=2906760 RepID=UPI0020A7C8F3|nr:cbb3-type cytochrome c oxidase N-terminal domain-containing protein [Myxococcus guangdongensis]MCP3057917.1 c-type cytochrome [Myxococcus guangdongensis]
MSDDKSPVLHVYDGIEEHDNQLPNWWLAILWTTLVFGAGYWFWYHIAEVSPGQLGEYAAESAEHAQRMASNTPASDELLLSLVKDPTSLENGKGVFQANCAACHGAQGQGLIGPNLTDGFWLHGSSPMAIHKVVSEGAVAKGMPAWERTLGAERVKAVTAYLLTLKGTNAAGGKAPQGEPETP